MKGTCEICGRRPASPDGPAGRCGRCEKLESNAFIDAVAEVEGVV
jgi:hypothetical protein